MRLRQELNLKTMIKAASDELEYAFSRGTFFYNDICNNIRFLDFLRSAKHFKGNRFYEMLGFSAPRDEESIEEAKKVLATDRHAFISPHSYYGSSPEILSFVREFARLTTLTIHLLENSDEENLAFEKGDIFEFLKEINAYEEHETLLNKDILEYLYNLGILSFKKLFLTHLVHANKKHMDFLNNRLPHAAWVLCMRSNDFIGEKRENWGLMQKTPLRLLIGTDSAASSPDVSILDEIYAIYKKGHFSEKQLFRAATFSAYEYLEIPVSRVPYFFYPDVSPSIESLISVKNAKILRG